jgi:hypothetical protein
LDSAKTGRQMERAVFFALIAALALAFLMFTFVFCINWEDYFFGTKLAGSLAGLFLFAKAAVAFALTYLLLQFPQYRKAGTAGAIAFFGFVFLNSSVTIRQNTAGQQSFSFVLAVLLAIPIFYLIITLIVGKPDSGADSGRCDTGTSPGLVSKMDGKRPKFHPILLLLGGLVILFFMIIFVIPVSFAFFFINIPFLHQMGIPPAHDTVLVKVDGKGNREWTTIIPGYSLDIVTFVDGEDGTGILYGTYWMPQQAEAQLRVIMFDRLGNRMWDMQRSRHFSAGVAETTQISWVEPGRSSTVVWLTNGGSLRLNGDGAVIGQTSQSDTLPQQTTEFHMPPRFSVTELPATGATIRIVPQEGQELSITLEDILTHKDIQSIYSVNPTSDGGYLISASVKP